MPVVFDNTLLALLFGPLRTPPIDPRTRKPVERAQERIDALVEELARKQVRILIPTPALCEFLSVAGRPGAEYLDRIDSSSRFQVVPFDTRAAVEAARAIGASVQRGDKRSGRSKATFRRTVSAVLAAV